MSLSDDRKFLKEQFLKDVKVFDVEKGYLSVPSFNLRVHPKVLLAASHLIADRFSKENIHSVHGVPNSGNYLGTAVSMAMGDTVRLHVSRKDQHVPATWKEIIRKEIRSFTQSQGGVDVYGGITLSFVRKGDRILLVDDVCAKGETGYELIAELQKKGIIVVGLAVLFDKVFQGGVERIESLGVPVFSCIRVKAIHSKDTVELQED